MEQVLQEVENKVKEKYLLSIRELRSPSEIKDVLQAVLFVPNNLLRSRIIDELTKYLTSKFKDPKYKIKAFGAFKSSIPCGFVVSQVDPYYTSYSRKCGTFGWLHSNNFETCKTLVRSCERFMKQCGIRKLRGNINFPKNLGGIGIQFIGFEQEMLLGVAYNEKNARILEFLDLLGYRRESEYICVKVDQKTWSKGKKIHEDIYFRYFTLKELESMAREIRDLAKNSFLEILPDASGKNRIFEFFDAFSQIPESFRTLPQDFDMKNYSDIPQFIDAWEACDLEEVVIWAPLAFDKKSDELVGELLALPDLFQTWCGKRITRANVDTAMTKKGYYGKGIFSALNNLGQITGRIFGIEYYEGTSIRSNNTRAMETIFPHCIPIRKHYVVQKRV